MHLSLEDRVIRLEEQLARTARTLVTTSIFTNILVKKANISDAEIKAAFIEAGVRYAQAEQVRSESTGSNVGNSGVGKSDILRAEGNRNVEDGSSSATQKAAAPTKSSDGNLSSGDESDSVGRTSKKDGYQN